MHTFKPSELSVKQFEILKWSVLALGIIAGVLWREVFVEYAKVLIGVALLLSVHLGTVWYRRRKF